MWNKNMSLGGETPTMTLASERKWDTSNVACAKETGARPRESKLVKALHWKCRKRQNTISNNSGEQQSVTGLTSRCEL